MLIPRNTLDAPLSLWPFLWGGGEVTVASVTLRSHFCPPCLGTPGSISLRLQRSAGTDSSRRLPCASPLPHVSGEWGWGAVGQTVHDRSTPAALQPCSPTLRAAFSAAVLKLCVPGPMVSPSSRNLVEMQILRPHPRPTVSGTLEKRAVSRHLPVILETTGVQHSGILCSLALSLLSLDRIASQASC